MKSLSRVRLSVTPWTVAHQAPPSMGFSKQEYWSGLPCAPPGDCPTPGTEPASYVSCIDRQVLYHWCHFVTWPIFSCMLSTFSIKFFSLLIIVFFKYWSLIISTFNVISDSDSDASLPLQTVVFAF